MANRADKRIKFIAEYLIDLNGTAAALRAGYSSKRAAATAHRILSEPEIRQAINKQMESREKRTLITADRVLAELYEMAFTDIALLFNEDGSIKPIHNIPESLRRAISSVEVDEIWDWEETENGRKHKVRIGETKKLKLWDKGKSLENLAKHLKLLEGDNRGEKSNVINVIFTRGSAEHSRDSLQPTTEARVIPR